MKTNMNKRKVIGFVASKIGRANTMRNVFAIIGIILTTILFTSVFTVAGSWISSMRSSQFKQLGTAAHGEFKYLTLEQYEAISNNPLIKDIGSSQILGNASVPGSKSRVAEMRYVSNEWVAEITFTKPTVGKLPEQEKEIALDTIMLDYLGAEHKLGEEIELTFTIGDTKKTDVFLLSGYWEGDNSSPASILLVSKLYADKLIASSIIEEEDYISGKYNAPVVFKRKNNIENNFLQVINQSGFSASEIHFGINPGHNLGLGDIEPGAFVVVGAVLAIVILSGYLIISNVFGISVVNDIQSYALYKIIGTTSKQLKRIVKKQAVGLCLVGIPLGLLAGYMVSCIVTPYTFRILNVSETKISANPLIFLATALFSALTVYISIYKSIKILQKVSPVSALRSNEASLDNSKKIRHSILKAGKLTVIRLAIANVFRYKKKTFKVILSIAFSLLLLNISYSLACNYDMDSYIANEITCDYMVGSNDYFTSGKRYVEEDVLSESRVSALSHFNGVERFGRVFISELQFVNQTMDERLSLIRERNDISEQYKSMLTSTIGKESLEVHLYGIDENLYDDLIYYDKQFDIELFNSGDYVLVSPFVGNDEVNIFNPGEKVSLNNSNGITKEYTVLGIAEVPSRLTCKHYHLPNPEFILPTDEYINFTGNSSPMLMTFFVDDSKKSNFENQLIDYCREAKDIDYVSKEYYIEMFTKDKEMFAAIGMTLSVILGLIGIVNYLNSMITSIVTRKREFALLSCVGMTSKQLNTMVVAEGLTYMLLSVVFALTVGLVVEKSALWFVHGVIWYISDTVRILSTVVCAPFLIGLAVIIPYISFNRIKEKTAIEIMLSGT